MPGLSEWARDLAEVLVSPLGRRWQHVQAVARCAVEIAHRLNLDAEVLVAAAWLHDIGYADGLAVTGFHPLDGARHLRKLGVDERVVSLVGHHSCARLEAVERELADEFEREFPRPEPEHEDALCYCDMTTGPTGERVAVTDRLDEIQRRYGPDSPVARFVDRARDEILASVERVERRLSDRRYLPAEVVLDPKADRVDHRQLGHSRVSMTQDYYMGRKAGAGEVASVLNLHDPDGPRNKGEESA